MLEPIRSVIYRIRSWFRRDALAAELEEELRLHQELLADDARRAGLSDEEARRRAAVQLGNATVLRERSREWWSIGWLEAAAQDLRYALRFLRRSPGFTTVAVLSLALGIGVNAAVFTLVDALLLRPPPHVQGPEAIYRVNVKRMYAPGEERPYHDMMTFPEAFALRDHAQTAASVVVFTRPERVRMGHGPDAPRVKEARVTADFFEMLGVRPLLGRFFGPDDIRPDALERPVVASYGFWQRHLGSSPDAIGQSFNASGVELTVIGVAPPGFRGLDLDAADYWVPLEVIGPFRYGPEWKTWDGFGAFVALRLRPGTASQTASAEATMLVRRSLRAEANGAEQAHVLLGPVLQARGPSEQIDEVKVSTRLAAAAFLVLVAACANLATLLLLRALTRRREIAVRMAIGISRRRLMGQLLLESVLLSLVGAAAALLAARWGGSALRTLVFPDVTWTSSPVEGRVLVFAILCAAAVALLAGLTPAIRLTRPDVSQALRSAAPQLAVSTGRLRQSLLVLQVALSVVLIVGAAVFVQSFHRARTFDIGYDLDRLVVASVGLETDTQSVAGRVAMLEEGARRVSRVAGVERALIAPQVPLTGYTVLPARKQNGEGPAPPRSPFVIKYVVTPELIETLELRLVAGRFLLPTDVRGAPRVALVSEELARRYWPNESPLGHCLRFGADTMPCAEIVGVVADIRNRQLREETGPVAFLPLAQEPGEPFFRYIVARTSRDAQEMAPLIRSALLDLHPDLASLTVRPLADLLEYEYRPLRLGATMFGAFAMLAVLLAGVGLYGILAFSVAQRYGEIGIRSALGARGVDLVRLVSGEAIALVLVGVVLGGVVSWFAGRAVEQLLFETSVRAAAPYAVATVLLLVVAAGASAIPLRRATRVDPVTALRAE
ncbi:MAG TPA: ADOP family duplicated permease [Gemmatimonadaceae bacterium]